MMSCAQANKTRYFKRLKLDYPTTDTTRGSRRFVKAMKHLQVCSPSALCRLD